MATELMRLIDYWLGIPLCFLLELFHRITGFIPIKKREGVPSKILFIKLSEMGAIILSYSLIKRIKEIYPESKVFFLTFKKNKPLVEVLDIIDSENILIIREDSPRTLILGALRTIIRTKKEKIDIVFDLELFSRFTAILTYLSGAAKRIGFYRYYFEGLYRGNLLTHNVQYNPLIHTSKSLLSLAQVVKLERKNTPELVSRIEDKEIIQPKFITPKEWSPPGLKPGVPKGPKNWILKPPSSPALRPGFASGVVSIGQMRQRLTGLGVEDEARIFLMNAGDGIVPLREWPIENYISLTRRLLLDGSRNYIINIGTGGVSKKAEEICASINNQRCLDLTNKTSFLELMSLFEIGEALIANDCGLAHISSLTTIKKFIIFGPESPQLYAPLGENSWVVYSYLPCSPCLSTLNHRKTACKDNQCLKAISTDSVYALIKAHLT